ncbi:MAG: type IV toxin-antitoxin system AbiEi family antitoxin domain-containing protein [Actinomycetota bacterium]|nr:type IV toxin-antitoxin system AbiEi family antitoxin domain-containing protein [Actinomycetota bacterium]
MNSELEAILDAQHGVLGAQQAFALVGKDRAGRLVRSGKWQRPARGVYVAHNGPLDPEALDWVASFSGAPGSVLGGLTALAFDGFKRFTATAPTVIQPMGARPMTYGPVHQHWSIFLDDRDVHPARKPLHTRPARSLIDAASWEPGERRAREIILAGCQQGLVATRQLREALTRRGACHFRGLIVESYLDARGGIQSLPERDFDSVRREVGLPKPDRQAVLRRTDGKYYLDVFWRRWQLACEVHGCRT